MAFKTYVNASAGAGQGGMAPIVSPGGGGGGMGSSNWHPDVMYMLVLVVAEIVAVSFIAKHL